MTTYDMMSDSLVPLNNEALLCDDEKSALIALARNRMENLVNNSELTIRAATVYERKGYLAKIDLDMEPNHVYEKAENDADVVIQLSFVVSQSDPDREIVETIKKNKLNKARRIKKEEAQAKVEEAKRQLKKAEDELDQLP